MLKLCLFAIAVVCLGCEAKYFATRCGLVHELRRQGFPEGKMRDWVCLIESLSGRHTNKTSISLKHGCKYYGLFQISDKYWCSNTSTPGKDCNVTCADLLTDDVTKASKCAKMIYERQRFAAWYGWINHCNGRLSDVSKC